MSIVHLPSGVCAIGHSDIMGDGRTVLLPVQTDGVWRVQITWANGSWHLFGKFDTKQEAERWISC